MEHDGWIIKMPTLIAGKYFVIKTFFHHLLFSFSLFQYVVFQAYKMLPDNIIILSTINMKLSVEP